MRRELRASPYLVLFFFCGEQNTRNPSLLQNHSLSRWWQYPDCFTLHFVGYRLTYDVDIITHLRYYYQRFFCVPSRIRAHIFKSVAWRSIRWTMETFWETRELHHRNRSPHNILILGITPPHFTSTEFFGYTSKFCNFCILLMGVLFWSSTPHPNTLEIQTLTKLLGNLLNKSPCSVSFCLCLYS